jgi:1-phosphofructokinase
MIYTVTLNPAIDFIIETSHFQVGETNYYQRDYSLIGGKGINVAIILNNLKTPVVATGFLGQENEKLFLDQFQKLGLQSQFLTYQGKTRTNFKIKNLTQKEETELNGVGQVLPVTLFQQLLEYLDAKLQPNDLVIAAGSVIQGLPDDVYYQIGQLANQHQALFFLDTSKKAMLAGLKAQPFLIKPNLAEISEILNQPIQKGDLTEIKGLIKKLNQLGARNILLSMGKEGSYFFAENGDIYQTGIAQGKLVNSVGAGDSMLAGFVYGQHQKFDLPTTLKYGAAAGGATAFSE